MKTILSISICLLATTALLAQKTLDKSFEGVKEISIDLASGDCTLKKGSDPTIKVHLEHSYDEDRYTTKFEQNGSTLEIKEKFESGSYNGSSKWTLTIPDGIKITLNSGSGDLLVRDLDLNLKTNTGSGDIDISDGNGEVSINTGSGSIDIENLSGKSKINTGSGDVNFEGSGEVNINVGSGDIYVTNSTAKFGINTGSGDIRADNVTIAGKSSFNSGSGDTEVKLQESLNHDISVNSGSGDAVIDFNNNEISGEITMKASKEHGRIDAPFKFDKVEEEENGRNTTVIKTVKIGTKDVKINVSTGSGTAAIEK